MKSIIVLDCETTSTEITTAKIVSIACIKCSTDFSETGEAKYYLVNPGIPIPKEASDIHGITDEMVADKLTFKPYAKSLFNYLQGADIAGFNSNRFDVPLLSEEFARVGIVWPEPETNFIDAYKIFVENEKRDLTAAYKFYCGKEIGEDAHSANKDAEATLEVLISQIKRYKQLQNKSVKEIDQIFGGDLRVDLAGTIILNDKGVAVYNIGKDKGKELVANPSFAYWMLDKGFTTNTKNIIRALLSAKPESKPIYYHKKK